MKKTKKLVKQPKKKRKIRYVRVLLCLLFVYGIGYLGYRFWQMPITNIYIVGNSFLSDQEVIESAKIENYPATLQMPSRVIQKNLEKNTYIKEAKVVKRHLREVTITVTENVPLFFYQPSKKTVLLDGSMVEAMFDVPVVVNYIPDTKYQKFFEAFRKVSLEVRNRISEIKYDPNDVDEGRFLLTMNDQNYVYLTLSRFDVIDKYIDIIAKQEFAGKKGILKLDAGNSFEILE